MRPHHPGRGQQAQRSQLLLRHMLRRNRIGGTHARHAQRLVRRPHLPELVQPWQRWRGVQTQRCIGAVQHTPGAGRCRMRCPLGQHCIFLPQRAGRRAGPVQPCAEALRCTICQLQAPDLSGLWIVAIVVGWQAHAGCALAQRMHGDAVDEFAGAARHHHAPHLHAMELRQLLAQRGIGGVRVLCAVRGLQGFYGQRAGSTGIAVGRKIMRRNAQCIRAAMHAYLSHRPPRLQPAAPPRCTRPSQAPHAQPAAHCAAAAPSAAPALRG